MFWYYTKFPILKKNGYINNFHILKSMGKMPDYINAEEYTIPTILNLFFNKSIRGYFTDLEVSEIFNNKNLCGVILYLNSIDVITIPIKIYETIIGRYSLDIIASKIYTKCELFDKNPNYQSYIDDGIKKNKNCYNLISHQQVREVADNNTLTFTREGDKLIVKFM